MKEKLEKFVLKNDRWSTKESRLSTGCEISFSDDEITIRNSSGEKKEVYYQEKISIDDANVRKLRVNFNGKYENAGGYLILNGVTNVPLNSCSIMDLSPPIEMNVSIVVSAESSLSFEKIEVIPLYEDESLIDSVSSEPDVLVVTPAYPSLENLYYCAFAHSRNKEYANSGLKIQVASISCLNWFQTVYTHDGIPVIKGTYSTLKELLLRHQYKVIITHFVDEYLYPIYDGYISTEKLIFICHGPETVFRYLVNVTRPYFTKPLPYPTLDEAMDDKEKWVKRFSQKDNVEWVFVSEWLKTFSEEELNIKFKHARVINNIINEDLFPYREKTEEDRCKILVIRKFDNIIQHSLDQVVLAILELSRRPFFEKLSFEIYGDGNYYDELVAPLKQFDNVHLHRTFIPNDQISKIHEKAGILLIPSRHDTQGVSMGEAAESGLVVVGTRVTAIPDFFDNEMNHILAEPEDYSGLADIIERLYNNPKEYLEISKRLSKEMRENYCKENTVQKEVDLIKGALASYREGPEKMNVFPSDCPVLTVAIPAYNVEEYIEKCLNSILRTPNISEIEVLVVNDGSKDKTAQIVQTYVEATNGIVRLINKENGGHGSTINVSISEAKGKYFRLVDGDDWVDAENLGRLVEVLKNSAADIVLTKGCYEYKEEAQLEDIIQYDNLTEGILYHFDDLVYEEYGFKGYGPLLTTGNYKTQMLRDAKFKITEKKPYVDMELNSFSLKLADTIEYHSFDIYRYLIGREGQTVSKEYWAKKYQDHIYIIFNIIDSVFDSSDYSPNKKEYIMSHILAPMIDSQIFIFDSLCLWKEIDPFLKRLKEYPEVYRAGIEFIEKKDGNSRLILNEYEHVLSLKKYNKPIIERGVRENIKDLEYYPVTLADVSKENHFLAVFIKRAVKFVTPYGLLKLYRQRKA